MTRRLPAAAALGLAAALALGGCGEDDGTEESTVTTAGTAVTTAASTTTTIAAPVVVNATLTGASEAPQPGDVDGSGRAKITLDVENARVCYDLQVANIDRPMAAHIHKAPPGMAGNIVVGLAPPTQGTAAGCTEAEAAVVADIAANPSDYYVNVHNAPYEKGAVRGQLSK